MLFVSPDPQLDLRREELHHHLPPPHRHALAVHEQRGRKGGEDRLIINIGIIREPEFPRKSAPNKRGFRDLILHSGPYIPRTILVGLVQSPQRGSCIFSESPNKKLSEKRRNY